MEMGIQFFILWLGKKKHHAQFQCWSIWSPILTVSVSLRKLAHAIYRDILSFISFKNRKFSAEFFFCYFPVFCSNHRLWVHVRTASPGEAVLTCTHNLCFGAQIRKIGIPLYTPVFLYKSGIQWGIHYTDMFS